MAEVVSIRPGEAFDAALRIEQEPGWHSYWLNPGDAGLPTEISWRLPPGLTAGDIRWPHPEQLTLAGVSSYGYSGDLFLPIRITADRGLQPGREVTLSGTAEWLICEEVCLPAEEEVRLTLPVRSTPMEADPVFAERLAEAERKIPKRLSGWTAEAVATKEGYDLRIVPPAGWKGALERASFFASEEKVLDYAAPQPARTDVPATVFTLVASDYADSTASRLRGALVLPEGEAFDAEKEVPALLIDAPVVNSDAAPPAESDGPGLALTLLLSLGGGLLLNLMPCVFPILSIKVMSFLDGVDGHDGGRSALPRHGLAFGVGVMVMFWALAGALLVLRAAGEQVGWGFQLQNPWIIAGLSALMVALAMNLLGVFEWGGALASAGGRLDKETGVWGAFLSGVLAVIVATPCTAPFMGAALGVALVQPALVALAVFTALAVGMALPVVLLSVFPAWMSKLPRPGPWMETLRQALAFPLLLTAVWLLWVFGQQTSIDGAALLLAALVLVALAAWVIGRWPAVRVSPRVRWVTRGLATVAIGGAAVLVAEASARQAEPTTTGDTGAWQSFDAATVDSLTTAGTPVFVDFTASWCLSCQVNKRTTLTTERVTDAFAERGVVTMRADWTNRDATITKALDELGRSGVPVYALYPAGGGAPRLLPEILSPRIVLDAVRDLPEPVASR